MASRTSSGWSSLSPCGLSPCGLAPAAAPPASPSADAHSDDAAVFAFPLDFHSVESAVAAEFGDETRVFFGLREDVFFRIEKQDFFAGSVAEHGDQRGIYVEESAFEAGAVDSVDRTLHQGAVAGFGAPQGLLVVLDFDGAGDLAADERENLFVAFAVAVVFRVRLNHQGAEGVVVDRERNAHPVERSRAAACDFAALFHTLQDFRGREQRFAGANEVVGQSAA